MECPLNLPARVAKVRKKGKSSKALTCDKMLFVAEHLCFLREETTFLWVVL